MTSFHPSPISHVTAVGILTLDCDCKHIKPVVNFFKLGSLGFPIHPTDFIYSCALPTLLLGFRYF